MLLDQVITPCPHELHKTQWDITIAILAKNYPKSIYGMGNFEFEQTSHKKNQGITGAELQNDQLQFLEGSNAKMHLTMLTSSSSYPKFIYWLPLFAKMAKFRFEFEFKFKFELNQKGK